MTWRDVGDCDLITAYQGSELVPMPYVYRAAYPGDRTASGVSYKTDTLADYVAVVAVAEEGDTEIDQSTYDTWVSGNVSHNAAIPAEQVHEVDPDEELNRALEAVRSGSVSDLVDVLQGGVGVAAAKGRLATGGQ